MDTRTRLSHRPPRWLLAAAAVILALLATFAPAAASQRPDWATRRHGVLASLGIEPSPVRELLVRVINGDDYDCGPTEFDAYVEELIADLTEDDIDFLINSLALDLPFDDALVFGRDTDPRYALPVEYRPRLSTSHIDLTRFWDIDSADIQLHGAHGDMLLDTARVARLLVLGYGFSDVEAEIEARHIADVVAASPALDGGNNPLFTLNAFAFSPELVPDPDPILVGVPEKIVIGDGILDALEATGVGEIGPRVLVGHEFGHHVQFDSGLFEPWPSIPEEGRRLELMADAFGTYWATHSRGLSLNTRRVLEAERMFFLIGDCFFDDPGHHGTPNQRMAAAAWGADLADGAHRQGHIPPSAGFIARFDAALPELVAPDAP